VDLRGAVVITKPVDARFAGFHGGSESSVFRILWSSQRRETDTLRRQRRRRETDVRIVFRGEPVTEALIRVAAVIVGVPIRRLSYGKKVCTSLRGMMTESE